MVLKARPLYKRRLGTSLSEINVTPFVDVMLVLLVIFMVTAPMIQSGISVNLPQAETESTPAEEVFAGTKIERIFLRKTEENCVHPRR